jgi:hypothetical protein
MTNRSMPDWRTWLGNAKEAAGKGVAYTARNVDADDPVRRGVTLGLIWVVWLIIAVLCWSLVWANTSLVSFLVGGLAVPLGVLYLGLRLTRGTLDEAEKKARTAYDNRKPVPRDKIPERIERELERNEVVWGAYRQHPLALLAVHNRYVRIGVAVWAFILFVNIVNRQPLAVAILLGVMAAVMAVRWWLWHRAIVFITDQNLIRVFGIIELQMNRYGFSAVLI